MFIRKFLGVVVFVLMLQDAFAVDVVFRYDDYRMVHSEFQKELVQTFVKHGIPLSLGVIPFDRRGELLIEDDADVATIKELAAKGLIEVCIHGYNHTYIASSGEFYGLSIDQQRFRLTTSKNTLDSVFDIHTVTFIPPWNSYDDNTLCVLDSLGIKVLSSCMTIGQQFTNPNLLYLSESVDSFGKFVHTLRKNQNRRGIIVFMFHNYDFSDTFTIDDLDVLLEEVNSMDNVRCFRFCDLLKLGVMSDKNRMAANIEVNLLSKTLGVGGMIQETRDAVLIRIVNMIGYLILILVFELLFLRIVRIFIGHGGRIMQIFHVMAYLTFAVLVFGCVWLHWVTPLKSLLLTGLLPMVYTLVLFIQHKTRFCKNG